MLSAERKTQIEMAHKALDRGDREVAVALVWAGVDGMLARIAAALDRKGELRDGENPKIKPCPEKMAAEYRRRETSKEKAIAFAMANPKAGVLEICEASGLAWETVRRHLDNAGIRRDARRRESAFDRCHEILAVNPDITPEALSQKVQITRKTARTYMTQILSVCTEAQERAVEPRKK